MTSSSIPDPPVPLASKHNNEAFPRSPNGALSPKEEETQDAVLPLSTRRQNLFMVFITLNLARSDDSPRCRYQLEPCDWKSARRDQRPLGLDRCIIPSNAGLMFSHRYVFSSSTSSHNSLKGKFHKTENSGVLAGGRLGAIYGHKNIFTAGCV